MTEVKVKFKVKTPSTPKFLKVDKSSRKEVMVDIADVSDEDLRRVADQWTKALLESAQQRRENRK